MLLEKNQKVMDIEAALLRITFNDPAHIILNNLSLSKGLYSWELEEKILKDLNNLDWLQIDGFFLNKYDFEAFKSDLRTAVEIYNKEVNALNKSCEFQGTVETAVNLTKISFEKTEELYKSIKVFSDQFLEELSIIEYMKRLIKNEYSFVMEGNVYLTQDRGGYTLTIFNTEHVPEIEATEETPEECWRKVRSMLEIKDL